MLEIKLRHSLPTACSLLVLTAESRVLLRADATVRTLAARLSLLVHLTVDEVATGAVVARVQLGVPLAVHVLREAAADAVRVRPRQRRVVPDVSAEPNREMRRVYKVLLQ
jgi:hypothetical protein